MLGGSGGSSGGQQAFDVLPFVRPVRGGGGGGAILMAAVNDFTIGSQVLIDASGSAGEDATDAGGGGR